MLPVATWNVLHRIHAVNWSDGAIAPHPDEDARIARIAARVATLAAERIVALQEVSGDQLAAVRAAVHASVHASVRDHEIVAAPYPRVPRYYRAEQAAPLPRDPTEFLVVIAPRGAVTASRSYAFANDPGKGFLAVQLVTGTLVVAAHTSWGDKATPQLAELASGVRAHGGPAVLLGDFNADRDTIVRGLGAGFVAGIHPPAGLATRPRAIPRALPRATPGATSSATPSEKSEHIDHVIAHGGHVTDVVVESAGGLSDHNLVLGTFVSDAG